MKTITVHRLSLQFDKDPMTSRDKFKQAERAVELVNDWLQRAPFGLNAQLIATPDEIEVAEEETDREEE